MQYEHHADAEIEILAKFINILYMVPFIYILGWLEFIEVENVAQFMHA